MSYVIVGGSAKEKFYLTAVKKEKGIEWAADGIGQVVRKVEKVPVKGSGCGMQTVGCYVTDLKKAKKFKTREGAEKMVRENPVLRYCVVEVV